MALSGFLIKRLVILTGCAAGVTLTGGYPGWASLRLPSAMYANHTDTEKTSSSELSRRPDLTNLQGRWLGQARVERRGKPVLFGHASVFVCSAGYGSFFLLRRIVNLNDGSRVHDSLTLLELTSKGDLLLKEYPSHTSLILMRTAHQWRSLPGSSRSINALHTLDVSGNRWSEHWTQVINEQPEIVDLQLTSEEVDYQDDTWAGAMAHPRSSNPICD